MSKVTETMLVCEGCGGYMRVLKGGRFPVCWICLPGERFSLVRRTHASIKRYRPYRTSRGMEIHNVGLPRSKQVREGRLE